MIRHVIHNKNVTNNPYIRNMYIYHLKNWPKFEWDKEEVYPNLIQLISRQQHLLGMLNGLGFNVKENTAFETEIRDILHNSEIEGNFLQESQVRSSIARNLGIDNNEIIVNSIETEGAINVFLESTRNFNMPLTEERLFDWHAGLFPTGRSGGIKIEVAKYRTSTEPLQIVSGAIGRERVHYEAPKSEVIPTMMQEFLEFANSNSIHPFLKACICHVWFEIIHPFEDGNGRIGRAIVDKILCEADDSMYRYYSFSSVVLQNNKAYYEQLNKASVDTLDITNWINWMLSILISAVEISENVIKRVEIKRKFWEVYKDENFNSRQLKVIKKLVENNEININTERWVRITKCTKMTATRDINELIEKGIFVKSESGGRSTHYRIVLPI